MPALGGLCSRSEEENWFFFKNWNKCQKKKKFNKTGEVLKDLFCFITIIYLFSVCINVFLCLCECVCMCVCIQVLMHMCALLTCGNQGTTCRRQSSFSALWYLRIELSSAGLGAPSQPAQGGAFQIMQPEKTILRKWYWVKIRKSWLKKRSAQQIRGWTDLLWM